MVVSIDLDIGAGGPGPQSNTATSVTPAGTRLGPGQCCECVCLSEGCKKHNKKHNFINFQLWAISVKFKEAKERKIFSL